MTTTSSSSSIECVGYNNAPLLSNAVLPAGFCAYEYPTLVTNPRSVKTLHDIDTIDGTSIASSALHDVLVLERGTQSVVLLEDLDGDTIPETKRTIASASGLNHGLAVRDGFVYASSDTTVYRWGPYSNLQFNDDSVAAEPIIVVNNINADGQGGAPQGHTTRTLAFDDAGRLCISVGSAGNVDRDSYRSRIRRFNTSDEALYPLDFQNGEVFADGLRNEVGLTFDKYGVLWGVENGADRLNRPDLGEDIVQDNPAEELNRFPENNTGLHYGYPYCFTEYSLPYGNGRGTVWAWPNTSDFQDSINPYSDADCNDDAKFVKPELAMQGHSAPLGVTFYNYQDALPEGCSSGSFAQEFDGFAFIAFHGSWNRDVPTGYKVVYVPINPETGLVDGEAIDLLAHVPPNSRWDDGFRPVDVSFDACGRLIVTSDGTRNVGGSKVVRIEYHEQATMPTTVSSSGMQRNSPFKLCKIFFFSVIAISWLVIA